MLFVGRPVSGTMKAAAAPPRPAERSPGARGGCQAPRRGEVVLACGAKTMGLSRRLWLPFAPFAGLRFTAFPPSPTAPRWGRLSRLGREGELLPRRAAGPARRGRPVRPDRVLRPWLA